MSQKNKLFLLFTPAPPCVVNVFLNKVFFSYKLLLFSVCFPRVKERKKEEPGVKLFANMIFFFFITKRKSQNIRRESALTVCTVV